MQEYVKIRHGMYRIYPVSGVFPLKKEAKTGAKGTYVTVATQLQYPFQGDTARIKVEPGSFEYCNEPDDPADLLKPAAAEPIQIVEDYEQVFIASESDDEAMDRIMSSFQMLDDMVAAAAEGIVRGLVVSGPPGIGKSFGVIETLRRVNLSRVVHGYDLEFEVLSGAVSPIGLYQKLFTNRRKGFVTCLDDCDGVRSDELTLNILKASLDSGDIRRICWNTESHVLARAEIPDAFDFEGSVIFLTNLKFEGTRPGKLNDHLKAIMSRCHYLDLEISNQRDQLLRIKQIVRDGMLDPFHFVNGEEQTIVQYFVDNADHLREISLRMVKKVADLMKMKPADWQPYVEATCLHRQAKFKRLLAERKATADKAEEPSPVTRPVPEPVPEHLVNAAPGPGDIVSYPELAANIRPVLTMPNNR